MVNLHVKNENYFSTSRFLKNSIPMHVKKIESKAEKEREKTFTEKGKTRKHKFFVFCLDGFLVYVSFPNH